MPRFSANISMLFLEHAFLNRFQAAKDAGFGAVDDVRWKLGRAHVLRG